MGRSFKKSNGKTDEKEKLTPRGVIIINGQQEIFVKKELITGFGYSNGSDRKIPLDQKTFHQKINGELPRRLKGQGKTKQICLLGPDPHRMGRKIATDFELFMSQNGLRKGASYEVKEVLKEEEGKVVKKKELQLEPC
jgi:hypothetical protein